MFLRETVLQRGAVPGAVIAIQTFGDLLGFNPHCHVLCTDGCFDEKALFWVSPRFGPEGLKAIFEHKVFRMLLSKVYEVDPLTCPKCQGRMKIIAFIEDEEGIEKILKHLELWEMKARPPPGVKTPLVTIYLDDSDSQISSPDSFLWGTPLVAPNS